MRFYLPLAYEKAEGNTREEEWNYQAEQKEYMPKGVCCLTGRDRAYVPGSHSIWWEEDIA